MNAMSGGGDEGVLRCWYNLLWEKINGLVGE